MSDGYIYIYRRDWKGEWFQCMGLTVVLLPKDLIKHNGGIDTFFPCLTLKGKKHFFPKLGYWRKLKEVSRDHKL